MGLKRSGGGLNGLHRHVVEETVLHGPDDPALDIGGLRGGRGLLEEFDEAVALIEDGLGLRVEVGAELRERREFAVVGELALHLAGDLLEGLDLRGGTDARDGETDGDGGTDALVEEVGLEEHLAVGDRDHVGRDVRGHVAGLRLDDRQRGEGALAGETSGALEEAGVEVEHVARVGFAAGRALQDERDLAVGGGVLGKVIVDDERILAVFHEPLADGGAGERSEDLIGGVVGGGSGDDHGEFHGAGFLERTDGAGDRGVLGADGDVDGEDRTEIGVTRSQTDAIGVSLVDDRVDRDGGLAGRAVTDDEFALATADWDHGVDGHDAGLHRLVDGLARDDAGSNLFDRVAFAGNDGAFAVERITERIDDATEEAFADGNRKQATRGLGFHAFFQLGNITHNHAADGVFGKIERDALQASGKLDHLIHHDAGKAVDGGDTVREGNDGADVGFAGAGIKAGDGFLDLVDRVAHCV